APRRSASAAPEYDEPDLPWPHLLVVGCPAVGDGGSVVFGNRDVCRRQRAGGRPLDARAVNAQFRRRQGIHSWQRVLAARSTVERAAALPATDTAHTVSQLKIDDALRAEVANAYREAHGSFTRAAHSGDRACG